MTIIRNVRIVTPDRMIPNGSVAIDGSRIEAVSDNGLGGPNDDVIDGQGMLLTPGLIDTHSDGLEKEIQPRRTAEFPMDFALRSFEARVRGSGVTTVCHGIAYQDKPRSGRSVERAKEMVETIEARRGESSVGVDHRLLFRTEARDESAVDPLVTDLAAARSAGAARPLVSYEDHTPGQGQYRDVAQFEAAIDPTTVPDGLSVRDHVQNIIAEAEALARVRDLNRDRLAPLAHRDEITLLAHDLETPDEVSAAHEMGASVAEFPVAFEAAEAASRVGMKIVMGAPNALRGRSHSANASARDLIAAGHCDALASDYMPSTLLGAVTALIRDGVASTVDAFRLVTSGPADLLGLADRGRIEVGARADLILIDDRDDWPVVIGVHRAADDVARSAL